MFLKHCWCAAGWAEELADGTMLARTIANEPILFWRDADSINAIQDRCPHRYAPLSHGKRVADAASTRARRSYEKLLAAETAAAPAHH